jgi:hypothetical protein
MVMLERNGFPAVMGVIGVAVLALAGLRAINGVDADALLIGGLPLTAMAVMLWRRKTA